jgi:hypothetical protein
MKQVLTFLMTFILLTSCGGSLVDTAVSNGTNFDCTADLEGVLNIGTSVSADFSVSNETMVYSISNSDCDDFTNGSSINNDYDQVSRTGNSLSLEYDGDTGTYPLSGNSFTISEYIICSGDDIMMVTTNSARLNTVDQTLILDRTISLAIGKCI